MTKMHEQFAFVPEPTLTEIAGFVVRDHADPHFPAAIGKHGPARALAQWRLALCAGVGNAGEARVAYERAIELAGDGTGAPELLAESDG